MTFSNSDIKSPLTGHALISDRYPFQFHNMASWLFTKTGIIILAGCKTVHQPFMETFHLDLHCLLRGTELHHTLCPLKYMTNNPILIALMRVGHQCKKGLTIPQIFMFLQDELLASIATTSSNAYHIKPMNSSLALLKETVKYLGKEWCSGMYMFIILQETNMFRIATKNQEKYR